MEFRSNEEKYLLSREAFRKKSREDFLNHHPKSMELISCANELISSLVLFTSGRDFPDQDNAGYIADLLVSFCRTYFISVDLMLNGEIFEAGVLVRKQIELLSRLHEFEENPDYNKLLKKTPNIKHIHPELRKQYSKYCEIAHSSTSEIMNLFGISRFDDSGFTPLYPEFQQNLYVCLNHIVLTVAEFYAWCLKFFTQHFDQYTPEVDDKTFDCMIELHNEVIPPALEIIGT